MQTSHSRHRIVNCAWAVSLVLAVVLPSMVQAKSQAIGNTHDQAIQESLIAIHPGVPGKSPFWNISSRRFIYVPAFDFKTVDGARSYRFTATCPFSKTSYKFEAPSPNALLSPIWVDIPIGTVQLKCEALDATGSVIGVAGERTFEKGAAFNGPYYKPEMGYKESAELALRGTFKQSYVRCWLTTGRPDPTFPHYSYPSKTIGAVIAGAAAYANLHPRPADVEDVLEIGRKAADYLIAHRMPKGSPYEFFPPTYEGNRLAAAKNGDGIMMIYPAEAAEAWLDLYDVVRDKKYLDAARQVGDTYVKTQLPNGAWHLRVDVHTGKPTIPRLCTPTVIIHLLGRLKANYGVKGYDETIRKAVGYVMAGPMKTYDWNGQFEDGSGNAPPYKNLARQEVCQFAEYLLENAKGHKDYIPMAEELLRFAEDQFVVWEVSPEHFSDELERPKSLKQDQAYWITPTVLEQYGFYVPVCRSMGMMLSAYQEAHRVTGKPIYLEKAKAIANALTVGQGEFRDKIDGQFPTLFSKMGETGYPAKWINNTIYPSRYLLRFSQYLKDAKIPEDAPLRRPASSSARSLPKVLIIGDSISVGYTQPVVRMLAGKADARRAQGNCEFTAFGLEHIREWLGDEKWDVIHFNWGIWDMHRLKGAVRTTPEQYEKNLRELVGIMKATGAKLIWASTTPVGPVPPGAKNIPVNIEDVTVYNAIAAKVMRESGVAIDDLYNAALPMVDELRGPDNRHFKPEGYEFLASHVVESIRALL